MKKIFFSFALLGLVLFPASAWAAEFHGGEEYTLISDQQIDDNLFAGGTNVVISGTVTGDAFIGASNATLAGSVGKDAMIGAGNVYILGPVGDDLRTAGGTVTISNTVGGELMAAGGMLTVTEETTIGKNAYLAGGYVSMNGVVNGDMMIEGDEVHLQGTINGNAVIKAETLVVGEGAVVTGLLKYEAPAEIVMPETASIGSVEYSKLTTAERMPEMEVTMGDFDGFLSGLFAFLKFMSLLILVLTVLVVFFVFKKKSTEIVKQSEKEFGWDLLRGFVLMIVTPMAVVILLLSVLGSTFGLILGAAVFLAWLLAKVFGAMLLGDLLFLLFSRDKKKHEFTWPAALVGALVFWGLGFVPIIGWLARCVFVLAALGAMLYLWYKEVWLKR